MMQVVIAGPALGRPLPQHYAALQGHSLQHAVAVPALFAISEAPRLCFSAHCIRGILG